MVVDIPGGVPVEKLGQNMIIWDFAAFIFREDSQIEFYTDSGFWKIYFLNNRFFFGRYKRKGVGV